MKRIASFLELTLFYFCEVLISNLKVAKDVLTPSPNITSQIETVKIGKLTDKQIFVLANMITMTPGTMSLEVNKAESTLKLHTLYKYEKGELQDIVKNKFERRILNVF